MVVVAFFGALCLADGTFALGVLVMGCIGLTSSGSWQLTSPLLSGSLSFIATLNDISVSSINTVEHSSKYKDNTVTWSRWYRHINFNVATKPSHFIQIQLLCTLHYCPACRTSLIATRFWVVMICPIIKCLTVLRVFFYFVWFVFIHHNFQFYFELCTYCNILDIYLSQNLNFVNYLLFYMKLLNYLFFNMFGSVLECCGLTDVSLL